MPKFLKEYGPLLPRHPGARHQRSLWRRLGGCAGRLQRARPVGPHHHRPRLCHGRRAERDSGMWEIVGGDGNGDKERFIRSFRENRSGRRWEVLRPFQKPLRALTLRLVHSVRLSRVDSRNVHTLDALDAVFGLPGRASPHRGRSLNRAAGRQFFTQSADEPKERD